MSEPSRFDEAISQAWQKAQADLGIRAVAPFEINIDGRKAIVEAFVPDFGGPNGAVALTNETAHHKKALANLGNFASILFPPYRSYSRERFIDTLNDWEWFGRPEEKPAWYTGKPWS
jgi:hypothetical protein